jgi:hypothetical protein
MAGLRPLPREKREINNLIPDEIGSVLNNMQIISVSMEISVKVKKLDDLDQIARGETGNVEGCRQSHERKWPQIVKGVFSLFLHDPGHGLLPYPGRASFRRHPVDPQIY